MAGGHDGSELISTVLSLLPGATIWTFLASLPSPLAAARASVVAGKLRILGGRDGNDRKSSTSEVVIIFRLISFAHYVCQVLEYHPEPWNEWTAIGEIEEARESHTVLSFGTVQLPCLSGR